MQHTWGKLENTKDFVRKTSSEDTTWETCEEKIGTVMRALEESGY
jgi:hypothetical protein